MGELSWWVSHGAALGWAAVLAGAAAGASVGRRRRTRIALRGVLERVETLGAATSMEGARPGDVAVVQGTLCAIKETRIDRPEDGAPVIAVGVIVGTEARTTMGPPTYADCAHHHAVEGLEVRLDDGRRLPLQGAIAIVSGSTEDEVFRRHQVLAPAVAARLERLPDLPRLDPTVPLAFRSLMDQDRVRVLGMLAPAPDGRDYRDGVLALALVPARDDGARIEVAFAGTPQLAWRRRAPLAAWAVFGAALTLASIAGLAELMEDRTGSLVGLAPASQGALERRGYRAPFGSAPLVYLPAVMSPWHRRDALYDISARYAQVAPTDAHHFGAAVEARRLVSCTSALDHLARSGRYEDVAREAPQCAGDVWAHRAALFALGRLDDAAALLSDHPSITRARVLIVQERWADAAAVLRELTMTERVTSYIDAPRLTRLRCVHAAVSARAGTEVPVSEVDRRTIDCRVALADVAPHSERAEILGEPPYAPIDGEPLAELLLLEAGAPITHEVPPSEMRSVFDAPVLSFGYSGLHAAARDAYGRAEPRPAALGSALYTHASMFEALTGESSRAESFARIALATHADSRNEAAVSVLVHARLSRGDVIGARRELAALAPAEAASLEIAIRLFGEADPSAVEQAVWWEPHEVVARGVANRDGREIARMLHASPGLRRSLPALASLAREHRGALASEQRWGPAVTDRTTQFRRREHLRSWAIERWAARTLGAADSEARAAQVLQRHRAIALRRETAVPLLLLDGL